MTKPPTSLLLQALVWSPLLLMAVTGLLGACVAPSRTAGPSLTSVTTAATLLLSPYLLGCFFSTLVLMRWAVTKSYMHDPNHWLDQFCTIWHLTNGTWSKLAQPLSSLKYSVHRWSLGCDVLSGLFEVMPVLRDHYKTIDVKHLQPSMRSGLDACYWTEATIHVPLSLLCFVLYVRRSEKRHLLEMFVLGVQLEGCVMYYLPEWLDGGSNWPEGGIGLWWGVGFGIVWVIVPIWLLIHKLMNLKVHQA